MDEVILQIYILQSQPTISASRQPVSPRSGMRSLTVLPEDQSFVIPPLQLIIGERPPFEDISSFILDKQSGEWITFVQVQF